VRTGFLCFCAKIIKLSALSWKGLYPLLSLGPPVHLRLGLDTIKPQPLNAIEELGTYQVVVDSSRVAHNVPSGHHHRIFSLSSVWLFRSLAGFPGDGDRQSELGSPPSDCLSEPFFRGRFVLVFSLASPKNRLLMAPMFLVRFVVSTFPLTRHPAFFPLLIPTLGAGFFLFLLPRQRVVISFRKELEFSLLRAPVPPHFDPFTPGTPARIKSPHTSGQLGRCRITSPPPRVGLVFWFRDARVLCFFPLLPPIFFVPTSFTRTRFLPFLLVLLSLPKMLSFCSVPKMAIFGVLSRSMGVLRGLVIFFLFLEERGVCLVVPVFCIGSDGGPMVAVSLF